MTESTITNAVLQNSEALFQRASKLIPGGVNSPVRAFKGVGGTPIFFKKGQGAYLTDVGDKTYIDYIGSWGPLILGHCHPDVVKAIETALHQGTSFGAPTVQEIILAERITQLMPSIEKIRMVNSGTEATLTAVRLARGYTQKNKIIKFNGCYHGHHDSLLVKAGSGLLTLGLPSTPGIPESVTEHTLVADFNDMTQVTQYFEKYPNEIAAIIIEPIAGNMGFILPKPDFLAQLRALCDHYHTLLIFDEVMTGFRVALGGAQALYHITPDLTTLGKVIGGGLPVGAVGGKAEIMSQLAPEGSIYQAGTLSGNPLAMAAGIATLKKITAPHFYASLQQHGELLIQGLADITRTLNLPFSGTALGGMFGFCFSKKATLENLNDIAASNESLFKRFFHGMLQEGIYFAPSLFEAGFISAAHSQMEINMTLAAAEKVLLNLL